MSSDVNKELNPLILDIGSSIFRLGWAGEDFPKILAPSIYVDITDFLFQTDVIDGLEDIFFKENMEKHLFGNEAQQYRNILKIHEYKKENNYSIFLKYFYFYYKQLKISSESQFKQPIIILTPFFMSELEKTKIEIKELVYFVKFKISI